MTPLEGETAIAGLVMNCAALWVIGGTLAVRRIWRVSTKTDPKPPVPKPDAEPVTAPLPAADPHVRGVA